MVWLFEYQHYQLTFPFHSLHPLMLTVRCRVYNTVQDNENRRELGNQQGTLAPFIFLSTPYNTSRVRYSRPSRTLRRY